jgi:iron complex transport system permease protein
MSTASLYSRGVRTAKQRSVGALAAGLPLCVVALALALLASIAFGAAEIDAATVVASLFSYDAENTQHLIIRTLRLPRALTAAVVGAGLAVAGAVMQALTRNPLADTGLLGIEAGAALAVVGAVYFLGIDSLTTYALFAFGGAAAAALLVYVLGSLGRGGATPFRLTIAGAAVTAFLSSMTTALLLFNQRTFEEVRFWLAGSVAGRDMTLILQAMPYLAGALIVALLLGRQLTTLSLGDDIARGLGQRTGLIKLAAALAVIVMAGACVALAGPIGFVGLVIPHAVRFFTGVDYRWTLPYAALVGATFLIGADVVGRVLARPSEISIGVMTALIGGPAFVALVRLKVRK